MLDSLENYCLKEILSSYCCCREKYWFQFCRHQDSCFLTVVYLLPGVVSFFCVFIFIEKCCPWLWTVLSYLLFQHLHLLILLCEHFFGGMDFQVGRPFFFYIVEHCLGRFQFIWSLAFGSWRSIDNGEAGRGFGWNYLNQASSDLVKTGIALIWHYNNHFNYVIASHTNRLILPLITYTFPKFTVILVVFFNQTKKILVSVPHSALYICRRISGAP